MNDTIVKIIKRHLTNPSLQITKDMGITSDLGLNSFELIQIVSEIEDECEIEIPDRIILQFKSLGDLMEYIEQ